MRKPILLKREGQDGRYKFSLDTVPPKICYISVEDYQENKGVWHRAKDILKERGELESDVKFMSDQFQWWVAEGSALILWQYVEAMKESE